jgi:hypothetical protein
MNERELDAAYTLLARTLSDLGEAQAPLLLARLAVLALARSSDLASAERLVHDAAEGLAPAPTGSADAN